MSIKVTADSNGDFLLNISTEGVPTGEFLVTTGGIEKTVRIVSAEELTPTPTPHETTKPFRIPIPGFESAGCVAALIIIVMLKQKRVRRN